jgi:hypothetical protein
MQIKECCKRCDFNNCKTPCKKWLDIYPEWLVSLPNEKLVKRLQTSLFNFTISSYLGNKPNYKEQDKAIMYEKEILRRLNKTK